MPRPILNALNRAGVALLSDDELTKFNNACRRMNAIASEAAKLSVRVLVDAEHTWYQRGIDVLAMDLMLKYNGTSGNPVIYNTMQVYFSLPRTLV